MGVLASLMLGWGWELKPFALMTDGTSVKVHLLGVRWYGRGKRPASSCLQTCVQPGKEAGKHGAVLGC